MRRLFRFGFEPVKAKYPNFWRPKIWACIKCAARPKAAARGYHIYYKCPVCGETKHLEKIKKPIIGILSGRKKGVKKTPFKKEGHLIGYVWNHATGKPTTIIPDVLRIFGGYNINYEYKLHKLLVHWDKKRARFPKKIILYKQAKLSQNSRNLLKAKGTKIVVYDAT